MRFFSIYTTLLSMLASIVAAGENPISYPDANAALTAGSTIQITWNPTAGSKVTLKLRYGPTTNLLTGVTIASAIPNTGSFFWMIPNNIGNGQWSIAITDGNDNDANYSPMFSISGGTGSQGSPGSASATAAPTTAPITATGFLATATGGAPSETNAANPANLKQMEYGVGIAAVFGMGALVF